jgi:C1A family cysteine protease
MNKFGLVTLLNSIALSASTSLPCHMCQFMMVTLEENHNAIEKNVCHYFDNSKHHYCSNVFNFLNFFMRSSFDGSHQNITTDNTRICNDLTWCADDDMHKVKFKKFVYKYGKIYEDFDNFRKREKIYFDNLDYIEKSNTENSYQLGMNQFGDLTNKEFGENAKSRYGTTTSCNVSLYVNNETSYNTSIDWVDKGAVTPIKNQGQCGSCWAFSTTGAVEGLYQIKTGKLVSLSEQDLVDCASSYGNQGCNGGLMDNGFQYIIDNGICTEKDYPYKGKDGTCKVCTRNKYITGCADVKSKDEDELMRAVAKQPVSIAIEADKLSFQFYRSGVYSAKNCGTNLDHGVLLVGYGEEDGKKYWKVKNSWGTTWGNDGYINILRGTGLCGVTMQPSVPI